MDHMEEILREMLYLQKQALGIAGGGNGAPTLMPSYGSGSGVRRAIAKENEAQLFYAEGGLFVDCSLERSVLNTLIQPMGGLANMIPVRPTVDETVKYAFVTQRTPSGTTPMDYPCDDPPVVGTIDACFASFGIGRLEYSTRTIELDKIIQRAHRGVPDDLYFVGNIRGEPAIPSREDLLNNNLVQQGAVRMQMSLQANAHQMQLFNWFWNGDPRPEAVTMNGAHGGWQSFWGLNSMIANDYGTVAKPWVTGTNCTLLNSDVKDFSETEHGGFVGQDSIFDYLQELESTIYMRAFYMSLLPTRWVFVMHPIIWAEVVKYLPCDMAANSCVGPNVVINANDGGSGLYNLAMRRQLENTMQLQLNGRSVEVVLDSATPITENAPVAPATVPTYTSSIYLVPLTVRGEQTLYWRHMNYGEFGAALAPIPNQPDTEGWSDAGRFHWIIDRDHGRCFKIRSKIEPALVFRAPHLAGRIDNVTVTPKQAKPLPVNTP